MLGCTLTEVVASPQRKKLELKNRRVQLFSLAVSREETKSVNTLN